MFIFQKQLAQQKQLEEVNAAGAIRTLRDAVKSAVALQRDDLVGYPEGITLKDASEFLPQEYFSGFRVAVRREGAKLSAVIVSPTSLGRYALDNLSAARISSMLGASGGFVPSLTDEPSSTASGTLGLWSLDINEISAEFADPVRIVVNIEFTEELGGLPAEEKEKILYRVADYGQASNTMLTALFFNDGTKDTIRIDPDGSFTNGAFTINPDGSITNGSFTVDSAGNIGSEGTITLAGGKFVVGPSGEITASGGRFSVDADGNVTASGLIKGLAVVEEGSPCNGGLLARDADGSTMLCRDGEWLTAGELSTDPVLDAICIALKTNMVADVQLNHLACDQPKGTTTDQICDMLIDKQVIVQDLFALACVGGHICNLLLSYDISDKTLLNLSCRGSIEDKKDQICDRLIDQGHYYKEPLITAACNDNACLALISSGIVLPQESVSGGYDAALSPPISANGTVCGIDFSKGVLFTGDGTFKPAANASYEITAIGGGGGGGWEGAGGGGSSALYGSNLAAIVGGGGGGGSHRAGGASGEVEIKTASMTKGVVYTVVIGQGGQHGSSATRAGGTGYHQGSSPPALYPGGNGADYKNASVRGGRGRVSEYGGLGGRNPGGNFSNGSPPGGEGYTINGRIYGAGGTGAGLTDKHTHGGSGAVHIQFVK
ncbi:hypothetical protein FACS1894186_2550 [Alphaproteobacteria bacterium]|nr:hypothetical protein FACS1894186_2550 [Alphaproteobacteria bacterium]